MRTLTDHAIPEFLLASESGLESTEVQGMRAEWHFPTGKHWRECRTKILYLHGGAFCTCNSRTHRDLLHRLALASQSAILAIDYRRPPEHPCPVAIDDGIRAYRWLITEQHTSPGDIFLAGDSAGGALTISVSLALQQLGDPAPAGAVLLSPWLDVSEGCGAGEGGKKETMRPSFEQNQQYDYLTPALAQLLADAWSGGMDLQHPFVSPFYATTLGSLPPLLIQAGEAEMLCSQIAEFAGKVAAAGGAVELQLAPEMPHVFQLFAFVSEMPEINDFIGKAGAWVRDQADHHAAGEIPAVGRAAWAQTATVACAAPITRRSGWLHRSLRSGFNRRFFVLIDGDCDAERLLLRFETDVSTRGCRPREVLVLRDGSYTVAATKKPRRNFKHCMRIDIEPAGGEPRASAGSDSGSGSSSTLSSTLLSDSGGELGAESPTPAAASEGDDEKTVLAAASAEELSAWMADLSAKSADE